MGGADSTNERAEEEEREAAKRREIREKELKEHDAFMRAEEEKREAAPAKRREIREKELKEHNALMRAEEEREDPPAKRPEIRELLEEHKALIREHLRSYEHRPHFMRSFGSSAEKVEVDSRTSSYGCMRSARSMDHLAYFNRAEKEREAAPAKRRELRKLLEEHIALMREDFLIHEPGPNILLSFGSSAEKVEVDSRRSSCGCMRSAHSMDHLAYFNRAEEEEREDPPAKRREIRKLLEEHNALMGIRVGDGDLLCCWRSSLLLEIFSVVGDLLCCWRSSLLLEIFSVVGGLLALTA